MLDINKLLEEVHHEEKNVQPRPFIIYECNVSTASIVESAKIESAKIESGKINPLCICDDDPSKTGTTYCGYTIMSLEDALLDYPDADVYIASIEDYDEVRKHVLNYVDETKIIHHYSRYVGSDPSLKEHYINFFKANEEHLNHLYHMFADERSKFVLSNLIKGLISRESRYFSEITSYDQYFPDILRLGTDEVFIDGGAYFGETTGAFIKQSENKYKAIHSFEPTEKSYRILAKAINHLYADERIFIYQYGLSNKNGKAHFLAFDDEGLFSGTNNKVVSAETEHEIDLVCLDDIIKDEVSYIKLDVEGSEMAALEGAKEIIRKYKPKLAVSLYHNIEDIIEIPKYISGLGIPYKYYLRHHGREPNLQYETVLYAI